jgi:hypothetical protein
LAAWVTWGDQHRLGIDYRLGVVALFEATARYFHDPRFFIRQVDWVGGQGTRCGRLRRRPRLLARCLLLDRPLRELGIKLGLLALEAFLGAGFDLGFRARNGRQMVFAALDLVRQLHPIRKFRLVRRLGQGQQFLHLGLQLRFDLLGVPI